MKFIYIFLQERSHLMRFDNFIRWNPIGSLLLKIILEIILDIFHLRFCHFEYRCQRVLWFSLWILTFATHLLHHFSYDLLSITLSFLLGTNQLNTYVTTRFWQKGAEYIEFVNILLRDSSLWLLRSRQYFDRMTFMQVHIVAIPMLIDLKGELECHIQVLWFTYFSNWFDLQNVKFIEFTSSESHQIR
jgi:hypothetical protein